MADIWGAKGAYAVTPTDNTDIGGCKALYVGTGGTVVVKMRENGSAITFTNVPNGALLPVSAWSVQSTSTTASGIIALL